jgi:xanthine/CO dehydrogenase XdhC/CoxF family maturation factor
MLERSKRHVGERVLATIVATAGSTYRKAGARMLLMADGNYSGLLSGGCFEADLVAHAREVLESGAARLGFGCPRLGLDDRCTSSRPSAKSY